MRVLSLFQPLATLYCTGDKGNETRSFATKYRGRVAIASSARFPPKFRESCWRPPFARALSRWGYDTPADLRLGAIVGWVTVTDCLEMFARAFVPGVGLALDDPKLTAPERAFGIYQPGRFAWVATGPRVLLAEPIPYKGGLGLRHLAPELVAQIESASPARPHW